MKSATFPGRFKSLAKISKFVIEAAKKAGLDDKAIYAVELAVDEAASNIIEHAYGGEGKGDIHCSCDVVNDGLIIILKDSGVPFDPDNVPELDPSLPLMRRNPGGAGMFLMRQLMDEVEFSFSSRGGNILKMFKRK